MNWTQEIIRCKITGQLLDCGLRSTSVEPFSAPEVTRDRVLEAAHCERDMRWGDLTAAAQAVVTRDEWEAEQKLARASFAQWCAAQRAYQPQA